MNREPFCPPSMDAFINFRWWAIHEAAFVLTKWPKEGLYYTHVSPLPAEIKEDRPSFFLPGPEANFDLKSTGAAFREIFLAMKDSIEKGELAARFEYLSDGITYLVPSEAVIVWALRRELTLPKDLLEVLGFKQIADCKLTVPLQNKVKNKIIGQFVLTLNPNLHRAADIYKHPLMQCYKQEKAFDTGYPTDKEHKSVLRAINTLFGEPGQRGRPPSAPKETKPRQYIPHPIPEVLRKGNGKLPHYHFSLLCTAISTAVWVLMALKKEKFDKMTVDEFVEEFLQNQVVALYLDGAPQIIASTARNICVNSIAEYSKYQMINHIRIHGKLPPTT